MLDKLAARTRRCAAVVGFVDEDRDLYNAAAVCANGDVLGTYRKRLLPNYAVFDEARYFTPGTDNDPLELYVIGGVKVGISICEDIWSPFGPLATQSAGGAELSVNINGSPYHWRKGPARERMIATRAADASSAIVYVNQVGGQDELVFDGGSLVFDAEGNLLARAAAVRRAADDRRRADPARSIASACSIHAGVAPRSSCRWSTSSDAPRINVESRMSTASTRRTRWRCRSIPIASSTTRSCSARATTAARTASRDVVIGLSGGHRLHDRRLHRRRRPRPRARARRVDAVALLERPFQVRRPTAGREPRHRLPDDLDRARVPVVPRHARRRRSPAVSRGSRTRTCRAGAAGSC